MKRITIGLLLVTLFIGNSRVLHGYDVETHRAIARQAAEPTVSSLDSVLKTDLGFSDGIGQKFVGRNVQELIGSGARSEDEPFTRVLNHFHDPLYQADGSGRGLWSQAGLFGTFQSSIRWGQNPNQAFGLLGGSWSWRNARQRYLTALTDSTKSKREEGFADVFRNLGQLTHLIQDLSVPAHVRNNSHLIFAHDDGYEDWASRNRTPVQSLIGIPPIKPDTSIFSLGVPIPDSLAEVPVARVWDSDQYSGSNPNITLGPTIGLAEYANANFFSDDTVFKGFPFPAQTSVELRADVETEPTTGEARRYFKKARDGDVVEHAAVPSQLHKFLPEALKDRKIGLDDRVYEDYARLLLPRAVGYSAGLLDYFFRGKLDVDLVPDPDSPDPTVVKLSGTNGSEDKLDGGMLSLYADDPVTGERSAVPAFDSDPNFTVVADPGQEVESTKFQINAESERFMAVYKGKLGEEKPEGDFPGGVIGKVLGGVRAESIFPQGAKRMLRTVDGVFPLPPAADRLQKIQWGDQDNTFAGILPDPGNSNIPGQVVAFKINRPIGSPEKPPLEGPEGAQVVSADILKAANFPFGLSLSVTVNYSQTFQFKQLLVTYDLTDVAAWQEDPQHPGDPRFFFYQQVSHDVRVQAPELVVDETIQFQQNFPIVLDLAHLLGGPGGFYPSPYVWSVEEISFDAQERLLALVTVSLTQPENNVRTINLRKRNSQGQLVASGEQPIFGFFQITGLLSTLIDIERGEVLGVTASSTFSPSSQHATSTPILQRHIKTTFVEGPSAGTKEEWSAVPSFNFNPDYAFIEAGTFRLASTGVLSVALPGWLREDLQSLFTPPFEISANELEDFLGFVDDFTRTNKFIRLTNTSSSIRSGLTVSDIVPVPPPQAQIIRPDQTTSPEVLLLFRQAIKGSVGEEGLLVRWSPQSPSNTVLALPEKLPPADFYNLSFTTSQAALLPSRDLEVGNEATLLVDFSNKTTQSLPGFLNFDYALLDPKFLYNINDTKFHTLDPSLRATALPRALTPAPVFRPPSAAYHLVRLQ